MTVREVTSLGQTLVKARNAHSKVKKSFKECNGACVSSDSPWGSLWERYFNHLVKLARHLVGKEMKEMAPVRPVIVFECAC